MTEALLLNDKKLRTFKGLSAEQRQAERYQKLMDAGLHCFGSHGFYRVTVREICAEAKLTERYFYESFINSEALFTAVYQHIIKEMQNEIIHTVLAAADKKPKALIKTGLTAFLGYIREDVRVARILFVDAPHVRFENNVLIRDTLSSFNTLLQYLWQLFFPQALNSSLNFDLISAGLNGANIHIVTYWIDSEFAQPFDEVLESCYTLFEAMADYLVQAKSNT